jgi:hypothetical protein
VGEGSQQPGLQHIAALEGAVGCSKATCMGRACTRRRQPDIQQACSNLLSLHNAVSLHRSCDAEIKQLRKDLATALDMVLQHKEYIDGRVQAVATAVQEAHQALVAMPVPTRNG